MTVLRETDPSLRRVQRDSAIIGAALALAALVLQRGRPGGALGVLAGVALMAVSYRAISGGVSAIVRRAEAAAGSAAGSGAPKVRTSLVFAGFIGRYAVVGALAWAVLVPLRADPVGLVAGVSVTVAAIAVEAVRLVRTGRRAGPPGA
ncbi:MAG TPA: hypothetical protein PLT35_02215 [Vicinamibacterales bacterium]|nr:hypothetical protein [Vicinamibacterales bacterium]